ncbi:MAG: sugar phosphate isomerase/epimerase [Oscillospiraceae bacterium]|nr:sugar phosphate isomerase/epimerase [Oscillospiraceae bacterium]
MKFGASIYSISRKILSGEFSPAEAVRWLCENGAEVIELVPFGIDMIGNAELVDELLNVAAKHNVGLENYSLNANFLQISKEQKTAEMSRVKSHIDVAGKLRLPTMRIDASGYRRPLETNTITNFFDDLPEIAKVYDELCGHALKYGITVLLENHGFHLNGSDRTIQIFETVKNENFALQLDTGNFACVDESPEIAVKKLVSRAKTIHIKDFYIRDEDNDPGDATQFDCSGSWFRSQNGRYLRGAILGQGDLNIRKIVALIKDSGFDGNIFVEFEGMEDPLYGTKVSLLNLRRYFD